MLADYSLASRLIILTQPIKSINILICRLCW